MWVTKCYFSVRNMASTLSEEQFQCSICLYSFKNPVSIPCGHNFCLECIKRYWDVAQKSDCPLCKESFSSRPELRVNWTLKEITERFPRLVDCNYTIVLYFNVLAHLVETNQMYIIILKLVKRNARIQTKETRHSTTAN